MFGDLLTPAHLAILLLLAVLIVVPYWQIFKKAGFRAPLSLLMVITPVNVVVLYILAFARWRVAPINPEESPRIWPQP